MSLKKGERGFVTKGSFVKLAVVVLVILGIGFFSDLHQQRNAERAPYESDGCYPGFEQDLCETMRAVIAEIDSSFKQYEKTTLLAVKEEGDEMEEEPTFEVNVTDGFVEVVVGDLSSYVPLSKKQNTNVGITLINRGKLTGDDYTLWGQDATKKRHLLLGARLAWSLFTYDKSSDVLKSTEKSLDDLDSLVDAKECAAFDGEGDVKTTCNLLMTVADTLDSAVVGYEPTEGADATPGVAVHMNKNFAQISVGDTYVKPVLVLPINYRTDISTPIKVHTKMKKVDPLKNQHDPDKYFLTAGVIKKGVSRKGYTLRYDKAQGTVTLNMCDSSRSSSSRSKAIWCVEK